jgi:hypothetical protein
MLEIKKIVAMRPEALLFDAQLAWYNANLESYAHVLQQYGNSDEVMIYGVELNETMALLLPSNYYRIDHHNQFSSRASSLEQVADVLNIELTREQQLIAANDRGYIPAMQQQGATTEEIRQIRLRDRSAQGVTQQDEQLALQAINNKTVDHEIIIIKSETNRFSPICDQLFPYKKLMIYTNDELMYYGEGKERLPEYFASEITAGKMFHGGGSEGFIGTAQGAYPYEQLLEINNTIIQLINQ